MPPPVKYEQMRKTFVAEGYKPLSETVTIHAVATLKSNNMNGGSGPLGTIRPPGWHDGGCPSHHNRGHLVGNAVGGSGAEPKNLVTLVAGTNHPIMYSFESIVKKYVTNKPGDKFYYVIWARYSGYTLTPGFPIAGAAGNPFCLFPAPHRLLLALRDSNHRDIPIDMLMTTADPN
ncbi:MAG TPA: DNA/RNA non-specific endonuclease, partial [Thermoanaerobaculia bacterium]